MELATVITHVLFVDLLGNERQLSVHIPLTGQNDYGGGTSYPPMGHDLFGNSALCTPPKSNCNGNSYSYSELSVDDGWEAEYQIGDTIYALNVEHTRAYWLAKFVGYTASGDIDFSMNCHGYAFGVGDWPDDGMYGALTLLGEGVCYEQSNPVSAKIALLSSATHSLKVVGSLNLNSGNGTEVISKTTEKFRESQIFELNMQGGISLPRIPHGFGASLTGIYKEK